ncbi:MAG: hypothetical protein GY797_04130 [Deltaproteobacteria bacterium]|nr:hypothetical protein [Deltaproteobacteria bacterium]
MFDLKRSFVVLFVLFSIIIFGIGGCGQFGGAPIDPYDDDYFKTEDSEKE